MPADLRVTLGALELANPILVAAGTFGYGVEFQRASPVDELGAVVVKTLTKRARPGNPPPRLIETPAGMVNSVGLQNPGLDQFVRDTLPTLAGLKPPIIVSILGESPEELAGMTAQLDAAPRVAAIELNLSCPNIHRDRALLVSQDADATTAMVAAARRATKKPLIAKLTPDLIDPGPIARAAEAAGADAIAMGNTFTAMSIDPRTRASRLGAPTGGLSGPAIPPLAVYRVWKVRQAVRAPIIGIGGAVSVDDALEFFIAGASAVAVGTASFADPSAAARIARGLRAALERDGVASVRELIGSFRHGG